MTYLLHECRTCATIELEGKGREYFNGHVRLVIINKPLTHHSSESSEGPWDPRLWIDFYEHVLLCANVHLEEVGSVQGTVHQHEQGLVHDIWSTGARVAVVLLQQVAMVVAVEQFKGVSHLELEGIKIKKGLDERKPSDPLTLTISN